jgi:hypothetical protein
MATILQFPQRNKGRVRKSTGPRSEGALAMHQFDAHPENVVRFDADTAETSAAELALFLCEAILRKTPGLFPKVKDTCRIEAALGHDRRRKRIASAWCDHFGV